MFFPIIISKRKCLEFFRFFFLKYFKKIMFFPINVLANYVFFFRVKSGTFFSKKVFDVHRKIWKTILFPFFFQTDCKDYVFPNNSIQTKKSLICFIFSQKCLKRSYFCPIILSKRKYLELFRFLQKYFKRSCFSQ